MATTSSHMILEELAERPFDRSLRLVWADWLLEQNDPRGEVIALSSRDTLSLSERRKIVTLTRRHQRAWLGPLLAVADVKNCRWVGGFCDHLALRTGPSVKLGDVGDCFELATVRSLSTADKGTVPHGMVSFFERRSLRNLRSLSARVVEWAQLDRTRLPFQLERAGLISTRSIEVDLADLGAVQCFRAEARCEIETRALVNRESIVDFARAFSAVQNVVERFQELRLVAPVGSLEAIAAWLRLPLTFDLAPKRFESQKAWSMVHRGVTFRLVRSENGDWCMLEIVLCADPTDLELSVQVAMAASVISQLGNTGIARIQCKGERFERLHRAEVDTLRTAIRRMRKEASLSINGKTMA